MPSKRRRRARWASSRRSSMRPSSAIETPTRVRPTASPVGGPGRGTVATSSIERTGTRGVASGPTTLDGGVTASLDAATTEPEADDAAREAERGDRNEDDL